MSNLLFSFLNLLLVSVIVAYNPADHVPVVLHVYEVAFPFDRVLLVVGRQLHLLPKHQQTRLALLPPQHQRILHVRLQSHLRLLQCPPLHNVALRRLHRFHHVVGVPDEVVLLLADNLGSAFLGFPGVADGNGGVGVLLFGAAEQTLDFLVESYLAICDCIAFIIE